MLHLFLAATGKQDWADELFAQVKQSVKCIKFHKFLAMFCTRLGT